MGKTHDEPQSRNEAIIQNMLGEENELLDPQSRIESLLIEILEQLASGSFEGFDVFELETANGAYCKITFDDKDYFSDENLQGQPFVVTSNRKFALCIPESLISETAANAYFATVIRDGTIYNFALQRLLGGKTYLFRNLNGSYSSPLNGGTEAYMRLPNNGPNYGGIISYDGNDITWVTFADLFNLNNAPLNSVEISDLSDEETTFNTILAAMKMYADATPNTTVTKYIPLTAEMQVASQRVIHFFNTTIGQGKQCIATLLNNTYSFVPDVIESGANSFATIKHKECDFANNKIYDFAITFGAEKFMVQCTCYEATALS